MFSSEVIAELGRFFMYLIPLTLLIYSLIDLLNNPEMPNECKIKWLFAIIFIPVIGAAVYLFYSKRRLNL